MAFMNCNLNISFFISMKTEYTTEKMQIFQFEANKKIKLILLKWIGQMEIICRFMLNCAVCTNINTKSTFSDNLHNMNSIKCKSPK